MLHRFADHNGEAARVVLDRPPGMPPVTTLHRHFRAGLDRYEPVTGLNDHPEVVAFHRLVFTTPSLAGRLTRYMLDDEEAQVLAVQRVLARTNWQKIVSGRTARDVHPEAVADADQAFAQLRSGTSGTIDDGS